MAYHRMLLKNLIRNGRSEKLFGYGAHPDFSSGVILIKNWCQHNRIRKDRYRSRIFTGRHIITKFNKRLYEIIQV